MIRQLRVRISIRVGRRILVTFIAALTLAHPCIADTQTAFQDIDSLQLAATSVSKDGKELIVLFPLVEVRGHGTALAPVVRVAIPFDVSLHRFAVEVVDEHGLSVPMDRLHHFVMTDPTRRSLFLPLALPIFGASKESPRPELPKYILGVPVAAGDRLITSVMFVNPEPQPRQMRVRLTLSFLRPGRIFPLFQAYPLTIDVKYPLGGAGGRHDFDLPAGQSTHSWQGSPAVSGTLVAVGGHAHDYATKIELLDLTTGDTVYHQIPVLDDGGRILDIPIARLYRWNRLGTHLDSSHTYRVTVAYDNPTGGMIESGGMGSVAGLFVPERETPWPNLDALDPIYRAHIANLLNNMEGIALDHEGH